MGKWWRIWFTSHCDDRVDELDQVLAGSRQPVVLLSDQPRDHLLGSLETAGADGPRVDGIRNRTVSTRLMISMYRLA